MNGTDIELSPLQYISSKYSPIHGYLSLTVCLIGSTLNAITISVLSNKQMVSPINRLLLAIAAVDLLTMLSYIPYSLLFYGIYGDSESPQRNAYSAICYLVLHVIWTLIFHTASVWLTVAVALFRCIHLTASNGKKLCDLPKANLAIIIIVIGAGLLNIPQCLVYNIKEHHHVLSNASWYYLSTDSDRHGDHMVINLIQFILLAAFVKITPCVMLTILSIVLIRIILSAHDKYSDMRRHGTNNSTTYTVSAGERKRQKQTHQTTRMLVAVIIIFIVIELPQGILFVLSGLLADFFDQIYWPIGNFLDLLTIVSCCVNFLLYCLMSSQFCELLVAKLKPLNPLASRSQHESVSSHVTDI